MHIVEDVGCDRLQGIASDHRLGFGGRPAAQMAGSGQLFDELVGDAGGVGRHVFLSVLAHPQELAFADLVFVAFDVFEKRFPPRLFTAFLQLAHHQALHLDQAGALLAMGAHFECDGITHPGAYAAREFGVPDETRRGFAALSVTVAAWHRAWCRH